MDLTTRNCVHFLIFHRCRLKLMILAKTSYFKCIPTQFRSVNTAYQWHMQRHWWNATADPVWYFSKLINGLMVECMRDCEDMVLRILIIYAIVVRSFRVRSYACVCSDTRSSDFIAILQDLNLWAFWNDICLLIDLLRWHLTDNG
jgi:hypothetical protein